MTIRAVIFDIYGTLLEVGPPPPDADARWQRLCRDLLHTEPRLGRLDFSLATSRVIARLHQAARDRGIPWPEVHWPSVVAEVLPELAQLPRPNQEEFLFRHIQTGHTTSMTEDTAAALRSLKERASLLGIASNAQAYTLRELEEALATQALDMHLFEHDLCFWSFEHGFSKPDPHVFQILTARLAARGIHPAEILMVGDRFDNDITPAQAHGWQTWQVGASEDGDWASLRAQLLGPHQESELKVLTTLDSPVRSRLKRQHFQNPAK
jgi:FMN phosphatase YigB (HAD superfamily)